MKLNGRTRKTGRNQTATLRREGKIPAVIYSQGKEGKAIVISAAEFSSFTRGMEPGRLSTTRFEIVEGNKTTPCVIKEIQYHPVTYAVIHIDFEELHAGHAIDLNVPVECVGAAECLGVKLGGMLTQSLRKIKVRCLPDQIPQVFEIDVRNLGEREVKRVSDLTVQGDIKVLDAPHQIVVGVVKR